LRKVLIPAVAIGVVALVAVYLHRSGTLQFNRPSSKLYPVTGIDVSHHQADVDWTAAASSGVNFAFIKASEGGDFTDPKFRENWRGAMAAGLAVGPYHFFTFCVSGAAQAEHFLRTAPPSPSALPPVADVEFVGNCTSWSELATVRTELGIFVRQVEQAWGIRPILYVTPEALDKVIGNEFHGYPIWIRSVFLEPPLAAFRAWRIWQFSDNSRVPGIVGPVDRNALRPGSSLEELRMPLADQDAAT